MVYERNYKKGCSWWKIEFRDNNKLWWCAKREWKEETGFNAPIFYKKDGSKGCDIFNSYKHSTRIYFGRTKNGFTMGSITNPQVKLLMLHGLR